MPTKNEDGYIEEELEDKKDQKAVSTSLEMDMIALIGDVTEATANEVVFSLLLQRERITSRKLLDAIENLQGRTSEELLTESQLTEELLSDEKGNIDFYISTNGGSADDMFGIYDVMRMVQQQNDIDITTIGVGKVMSAGVLLLAAGTKGKRRVGRHCRIMIHSVIGGHTGPMHQLENEFEEIKKIQDNYIRALASESNMSEQDLRTMLQKKTNIYLTAEEAVKLGIADEVF